MEFMIRQKNTACVVAWRVGQLDLSEGHQEGGYGHGLAARPGPGPLMVLFPVKYHVKGGGQSSNVTPQEPAWPAPGPDHTQDDHHDGPPREGAGLRRRGDADVDQIIARGKRLGPILWLRGGCRKHGKEEERGGFVVGKALPTSPFLGLRVKGRMRHTEEPPDPPLNEDHVSTSSLPVWDSVGGGARVPGKAANAGLM